MCVWNLEILGKSPYLIPSINNTSLLGGLYVMAWNEGPRPNAKGRNAKATERRGDRTPGRRYAGRPNAGRPNAKWDRTPSETECQADWTPRRHERQVYLFYVMEYVLVFNLFILCYGICFGIQYMHYTYKFSPIWH